jgi:hypothetical protein
MSTPLFNSPADAACLQLTPLALMALGGGFWQVQLDELLTTTPRQGGGDLAVIAPYTFHSSLLTASHSPQR